MTNVLIDTSVWVDHFRRRNSALVELVEWDRALTHPMVIGELACGTPPAPRSQTLSDIELLRGVRQISINEVMTFIEREKLFGMGCGLVDMMLLGSVLITSGAQLWTLDRRLMEIATRFGVSYQPAMH
ncbi:type II toxin-antitoxin system VapC family toxin [Caballeronia sp. BR00000012568055]|uniref:type II toxin-antitoxin system VapC family toxin n=1 Tax=Caballeronia sp. BR00000012568055 TaxID=2918761 RepID=UPI0023F61F25|nr:PIN domain-containing protein [Caballeronia sp. BR00000012568055]